MLRENLLADVPQEKFLKLITSLQLTTENLSKRLAQTQDKLSNNKMAQDRLKFELASTQQSQEQAQQITEKLEHEMQELAQKLQDAEVKAAQAVSY